MGRIKSALEIALERTESVKGNKESINRHEAKARGKRLANQYLSEGISLEAEIKKAPKDEQESLKQGIFDVLSGMIKLPVEEEDLKRLETVGKGLSLLVNNNRFTGLYKQLREALSRYLQETVQYEEAIVRQYEPKLRQKEEELSRRMGRQIRLDPFQDPEFVAFYNQHMNALKDKYQAVASQVREEAAALFDKTGTS
ncbi:MAG: hypothetical protein LBI90_10610 [Treponema sp.]|jgi:hypothetical protein|nr:hypothetical protein [Treponema sp.]